MAVDQEYDRRRQFDRKRLEIEIQFEGGAMTGAATTRDVGLGGLYVATKAGFPVNTPLKLRLQFGETILEINGSVVYQDAGEGLGIRFMNLTPETEAVLRRELSAIETAEVKIKSK